MPTLDLAFVCRALNLPAPQRNPLIRRVITDSRQAAAADERGADLFVALAGEKHDGHDFVPAVLEQGALALVSRTDCAALSGSLQVADTLAALQTLAAAWREAVNPLVLGITGSSGKTTVKEMLAAILRRRFGEEAVLATAGNFNNHIGLPLTLLSLRPQHRYAVIEMGMSHFGELDALTRLARPDAALVNNALRAHIGCGFDGVGDIARAKSEIYRGLPENGTALVPAEDEYAEVFRAACRALNVRQIEFGVEKGEIHAANVQLLPLGCRFDLVYQQQRAAVVLPVPGKHNVANAVAAAALAVQAGVSLPEIAAALADFANIKGRLQRKAGLRGTTLIDDTYNANPDSMKAALDVLAALPAPRIFVMGDMGELGDDEAPAMHAEIGRYARDKGIEAAYFVGDFSVEAAEAFGAAGLWFAAKDPLIQVLAHDLPERASVLVKGSRFMAMEDVVQALQGDEA
ncbi:UDP-N-acetylmuramoyl-tripeptide--D-alanyl-D-alanine ligase [Eikenella sp. S3360]|uniref:UDP-N-acetylmuramoyl-tripeptide--D-alanyl-D-alanine ligase n=1 Tax=Eikenella glucosivorans TaxID=2766967 RepID=A0ABS0NAJ0_9NEIS|nr:UDP-N-acetylmuramoyl-tripeptide--D-alanyl-D-alanine ligase [Eikenella glucosivorans]MBH5329274.1 UDP-N-acetylmuramoyl-tripeptide--D-alanyl-D-alanine ligase [Eikenella glucosivorans]